jgi:hypothetical protein
MPNQSTISKARFEIEAKRVESLVAVGGYRQLLLKGRWRMWRVSGCEYTSLPEDTIGLR